MDQVSHDTFTPIKSLLYWRKSKLNGFLCVPAILTLDASKTLTLRDAKQNGFSVPLSEAVIKFSTWGMMYITVAGKRYDIMGYAAYFSPSTTKEQDNEIKQAAGRDSSKSATLSKVGTAALGIGTITPDASILGGLLTEMAYYDGLGAIKVWQEQIVKAGGDVITSKMKGMNYINIAIAVTAIIITAIVIRINYYG